MYNRKWVILTLVVLFLSFCFVSPSNVISAAYANITIEQWDTYNIGDTADTGSYGSWACTYDFEVSNEWSVSGDRSWRAKHIYNALVPLYGFYNLTDFSYAESIKFYFNGSAGCSGANNLEYNWVRFYLDGVETAVMHFAYGIGSNAGYYVRVYDYDNTLYTLEASNPIPSNRDRYMVITHVNTNIYNYSVYWPSNDTLIGGVQISSRSVDTHTTWDQIIWSHNLSGATGGSASSYIDDIIITTSDYEAPPGSGYEGSVYFNVYDSLTGEQLYLQGSNVNYAMVDDRIWVNVQSDLWSGEYDSYMSGYTLTITDTFLDGSSHTLELTGFYGNNILGEVNDVSKSWWNYTATFKWYRGQTYSITVTSTDMGEAGYPNCGNTHWPSNNGCMSNTDYHRICTDKDTYAIGERCYVKWYMPSKTWLAGEGDDLVDNWELELWDESEVTWNAIINYMEGGDWFAPATCDWIYFDFLIDADFADEFRKYKLQLVNRDPWFDYTAGEVFFHCTGDSITPEADLVYISPATPRSFQQASIAWTSNCTVKIEIERLGSGDDPDIYYDENRNGTELLNITFWLPGDYVAKIYGFNGLGFPPNALDTLVFSVTGDQAPWPGAEYLEIIGDPYYIAGQPGRNVTLRFKTLVNESNLTIVMPNGATSMFSRTVNISDYMHSFWLPGNAPIGEWTITLYGQGTHVNYFYVISEEGNYIEFGQNVYYDEQYFNIILKHTHYVGITFFKDGIAQGETWRLLPSEHAEELTPIVVNPQYARASHGNWRVEMWRLNEENIVKLLSADNCTVVSRPTTPPGVPDSDLGSLVQNAFPDPVIRTIIGLVLCLVITLLPYLVALKMKERHVTINIPTVIYAVCFGVGVAISYILGFFGFEILFFIVFLLISVMALMFLYGKRSASSGSEA